MRRLAALTVVQLTLNHMFREISDKIIEIVDNPSERKLSLQQNKIKKNCAATHTKVNERFSQIFDFNYNYRPLVAYWKPPGAKFELRLEADWTKDWTELDQRAFYR